ncbi:MAG: M48 family metallopeptidase, partial [Planctomycetota bacterium]
DRVEVPTPSEEAQRYYRSGNWLWFVNTLWGLLIPGLFLFTGLSARLRDWATKLGRKWFFIIGFYFIFFIGIHYIISFPLSYYQGFVRPHAFDLSNQSFSKWFGDSLKALMLGGGMGFLFLWVPYGLVKRSPRRWWLYVSLLSAPTMLLMAFIVPIWVAPLFNDFGDLKNKVLEAKVLALAEKCDIADSRIFEVNKSVDTTALNAYVTGFLNTKRIVLWDTIIAQLEERELLAVLAHEMGHYVLDHVWRSLLYSSLLILAVLYLIHRTAWSWMRRFRGRFGFDQLGDVASFPLVLLLIHLATLVVMPIPLALSRYHEHEADRFALEMTRDNSAMAHAFVKLQQHNLSNPRPGWIYKLWRATHPPLGERIDFCNRYRPWQQGGPLIYQDRFR